MGAWIPLVGVAGAAGFYFWLGLHDGRLPTTGLRAGSRATGILLFIGITVAVQSGYAVAVAIGAAVTGVYLLGWFRGRRSFHIVRTSGAVGQ